MWCCALSAPDLQRQESEDPSSLTKNTFVTSKWHRRLHAGHQLQTVLVQKCWKLQPDSFCEASDHFRIMEAEQRVAADPPGRKVDDSCWLKE